MFRHSTAAATAVAWWLSAARRPGLPNGVGIPNTAPPRRRARNGRMCRGAVKSLFVPVLAAAMLLNTSAARAVDSFDVSSAESDPFCQIFSVPSDDNFKFPAAGLGSFGFSIGVDLGVFVEGSAVGKARLTGLVLGAAGTFAVDLVVEGRLDESDELDYSETCRAFFLRCGSSAGWRVYTALSGTLTGVAGDVDGAVYSVSLGPPHPLPMALPSAMVAIPRIRCSRSGSGRIPIVIYLEHSPR